MRGSENAYVERLDNIFAEIFQALDLDSFLLERVIELGVIERDGDVARDGKEQLDVFAGKKIAIDSFAEAEDRDGAFTDAAGNVVIQVEGFDGAADGRLGFFGVARRFVEINIREKIRRARD